VPRPPLRTRIGVAAARAASAASRLAGRSGSVIGGHVLLRVDPAALAHLSRGRQVCLVSATNGKTTTTHLLSRALRTRAPVVTNVHGANLVTGLGNALASDTRSPVAVLEVDEAALPKAVAALDPEVVVLLNLSRDQLDRYGEVRKVVDRWREALGPRSDVHVVANADDPLVTWAAMAATSVTWVSVGQPWRDDAFSCPRCGGPLAWEGDAWSCAECGLARPRPDARVEGTELVTADGRRVRLQLRLPGRCNLANAGMAAVAASVAGADLEAAVRAMAEAREVAGRYTVRRVGATAARLLLAKNPAGWLETFDLLAPEPAPVVIAINANAADGEDPSWLYDVPFDQLGDRVVVATGDRASDLAVRLRYAGVACRYGGTDPVAAIRSVEATDVDVVGNYTAFQSLLGALSRAA